MSKSNHEIPTPCPLFLDVVSIRLLFRSTTEYNEDHIGTIRKTRGSSVRGIYRVQREELTRTWQNRRAYTGWHGVAGVFWHRPGNQNRTRIGLGTRPRAETHHVSGITQPSTHKFVPPRERGNIRNTGLGGAERHASTGYVGLSAAWSGGLVWSSGAGAPSSDGLCGFSIYNTSE